MKICIIVFANLNVTPYLNIYAKIFDKGGIKFDVIYWDRKDIDEKLPKTQTIRFNKKLKDGDPKSKKLIYMLRFSFFVKRKLKKNNYDYIVVLTSLLGFFLSNYLVKEYNRKYIFDVRDYSYEHVRLYKNKMDILMRNSLLNVISSPDFVNFLPNRSTIICHNMNYDDFGLQEFVRMGYPLIIGYIGNIRYADECERFLLSIKNDKRIIFEFYGDGIDEQRIRDFCKINNIENVAFYGRYSNSEKGRILERVHLIFNGYGNRTSNVKYALSNKYYDALYYKKPIIVNSDTSMEAYSNGFSYVVDYNNNIPDSLCDWYDNIKPREFTNMCLQRLKNIINENKEFAQKVVEVLK